MAGRIRSIKPEWLDDEKLCSCSAEARLLSVALLLLADDYGNGRAHPALIAGHVFNGSGDPGMATRAMGELAAIGYVELYQVRGQDYFSVRNWAKHQKVDKPGKPRVPAPSEATSLLAAATQKAVYFILGASTGLIKIGESVDPVARLTELAKCGSEALHLLAVVANGSRTERELHAKLSGSRVHGEWFRPSDDVLAELAACGGDVASPIATAGYDGKNRTREFLANPSRADRESVAPDLRSPITDLRPPTPLVSPSAPKAKRAPPTSALPPDAEVPAWLASLGVPALDDPTHGADVAAWVDYHRARGTRFASWAAAWRTWQRNAQRFARPPPNAPRPLVQRQQGLHEAPRDLVTGLPWGDP